MKTPLFTQEIKERIATDLRNRYSTTEINLLLDTCSFLDPRFKQDFSTDDEPVDLVMSEMENILKEPPHVQPDSPNVLEPVFEPVKFYENSSFKRYGVIYT